jgi:transcriptional regulator with XRE-family HTH domain
VTDAQLLGSNIQKARKAAGLSQEAAAEALGVHFTTLSRWENGRQGIPADMLRRLAHLYRVTLQSLAEGFTYTSESATSEDEAWSPNPAYRNQLAPRAYEVALGYMRRLERAGMATDALYRMEAHLMDPRFGKVNKRGFGRELTEDEQVELVDATWASIAEVYEITTGRRP